MGWRENSLYVTLISAKKAGQENGKSRPKAAELEVFI
jgi:hypothetical protein